MTSSHGTAQTSADVVGRRARVGVVVGVGLAGVLLLAGCGGSSAATAAPASAVPSTAVPATASAATSTGPATSAATALPSIDAATPDPAANGGFAFPSADVIGYYQSVGFACEDPSPSTQSAGYTLHRCLKKDDATGATWLVGLVLDADGVTGNAFAGVINDAGGTVPTADQSIKMLGGFLGAMLGKDTVVEAGPWLAQHLGEGSAKTTYGGILTATYVVNDSTGAALFVEMANQAFLDAPSP